MISEKFDYTDGITNITVVIRGGQNIFCEPEIEKASMDEYKAFEMYFIIGSEVKPLTDILTKHNIVSPYTYETSMLDNIQCVPYVRRNDLKQLKEYLKKCGFSTGTGSSVSNKKCNGVLCRVCNEFNEWAEPDNINKDSKYTCYKCGTNPYRFHVGLEGDSQIAQMRLLYKGKGFM